MGNSLNLDNGIKYNINQEFEKVRADSKKDFLTIKEVLKLQPLDDYPMSFDHFANLYVMDFDKDGLFSIQDLESFACLCKDRLKNVKAYEFQSQLQAVTSMILWKDLNLENGEELITDWLSKVLLQTKGVRYHKKYQNVPFIRMETIMIIYEIFHVKILNGIDIQGFFDLLQQCGEETGLMALEAEELDEYVALPIVQEFTKEYLKGFSKLYCEIGLNIPLE